MTGSIDGAIVLQAGFFSAAHGYHQTAGGFAQKFLIGVLFGVLAQRRNTLFSNVITHAWLDLSGGILAAIIAWRG
jgi:hypothetical protein